MITSKTISKLKKEVILFSYKKKKGEERIALGTINKELLPVKALNNLKETSLITKECIIYWDIKKSAWRSFRKENFGKEILLNSLKSKPNKKKK